VITTWNAGAERLFGYLAEEIIGQPISVLIPPDRQDEERTIIERVGRGERVDHYETMRLRKDGSLVPVSLTVSPVRNSNNEIIGASKIARDISERKQKEEHIALLAREVDHRAMNLLAVIQATVRLAHADTPEALKAVIEGRIKAIANVHTLLERSRWAGAELRSLVAEELSPYLQDGEARAELIGPNLMLKPKVAQSIAIILHELMTNAVKYGALSVSAGRVRVQWSDVADGKLVILWTEKNGPPVKPPERRGFGTRVVDQLIQSELNGEVHFEWRAEGLVCRLAFDTAIES